jgi:prefoldin subunit 5
MAIKSQISKIVSSQIGPMQGKLRSNIQKKVLELLKEFANGCPNADRMKRIMATRNNLLNTINSFQKRVDAIKPIANNIQPAISVAKAALQVIVNIPIPTAIIPPMSGGVGVPMSILNRYSRAITVLSTTIDVLEADVKAVNSIVTTVSVPIATLRDRLQAVDIKIAQCSSTDPNSAALLETAQPQGNTGSEGTPNPDYLYKGYTLEIIEDPDSPKIAPRRYAIAKDSRGNIKLIGQPSFSSSTQVLLDEIKFKIDNQLV